MIVNGKYKAPISQGFLDYVNHLIVGRLKPELERLLGYEYGTQYAIAFENSIKTFTLGLVSMPTEVKRTMLKNTGLEIVETAFQIDSELGYGLRKRGNDAFFTIPKDELFISTLTYDDMVRQRLVPRKGPFSVLGVDTNNSPFLRSLGKLKGQINPHIGFIGKSGSGKTYSQQFDLFNFIRGQSPDNLRVVMIDIGKNFAEWFYGWHNLPHLACPRIKSGQFDLAQAVLSELLKILNLRTQMSPNDLQKEPFIMVVIDEVKTLVNQGQKVAKKGEQNNIAYLLGELMRLGRSMKLAFSFATQDETKEGFGTSDIMDNLGTVLCGVVRNTQTARNIVGGTANNRIDFLPRNPGEYLYLNDSGVGFVVVPEMDQSFLGALASTQPLEPLFDITKLTSEEVSRNIDLDCPIKDDWGNIPLDFTHEQYLTLLRSCGPKGKLTLDNVISLGLTTNRDKAAEIRDLFLAVQNKELEAIKTIENSNIDKLKTYNPFPCPITE